MRFTPLPMQFNQENPIMLTQEGREGAIYEMDNKAEIEQQQEEHRNRAIRTRQTRKLLIVKTMMKRAKHSF